MRMRLATMLVLLAGGLVLANGCASQAEPGDEGATESVGKADSLTNQCAAVRCFAAPQCAAGQHAIYTPEHCCGTCVGRDTTDRCAAVQCPELACAQGSQRVY